MKIIYKSIDREKPAGSCPVHYCATNHKGRGKLLHNKPQIQIDN